MDDKTEFKLFGIVVLVIVIYSFIGARPVYFYFSKPVKSYGEVVVQTHFDEEFVVPDEELLRFNNVTEESYSLKLSGVSQNADIVGYIISGCYGINGIMTNINL